MGAAIRVTSGKSNCGEVSTSGCGIVGVGVCVLGGIIADLSSIATIAVGCPDRLL